MGIVQYSRTCLSLSIQNYVLFVHNLPIEALMYICIVDSTKVSFLFDLIPTIVFYAFSNLKMCLKYFSKIGAVCFLFVDSFPTSSNFKNGSWFK